MTHQHPRILRRRRRLRSRGFSFAEIMFAVMLLGIGFIMVAAIFPVAIQQQQATVEATTGKEVARNGAALVSGSQYMTAAALPPTRTVVPPPGSPNPGPMVYSFYDSRVPTGGIAPKPSDTKVLWDSIKGSLIVPGNERLGFVALYSRDLNSNFAKLYVFAVECRNASMFVANDVNLPSAGSPTPNLAARKVTVSVVDGGATDQDEITITSSGTSNCQAAVEGAYVIISDDAQVDNPTTTSINEQGSANGRIARLGVQDMTKSTSSSLVFKLAPGSDLVDTATHPGEALTNATAFVIGRGYADTNSPPTATSLHAGPSMAISRYVKLIPLQ